MKNTEVIETSTTENQKAQNERNLGFKTVCEGNVFKGKQPK